MICGIEMVFSFWMNNLLLFDSDSSMNNRTCRIYRAEAAKDLSNLTNPWIGMLQKRRFDSRKLRDEKCNELSWNSGD